MEKAQTPSWARGASAFLRSIEQTAGTVTLGSGKILRGWVTHVEGDEYFHLMLAERDESPSSGRDIDPPDDSPTALVRVDHVATWEYAGEDSW